MVGFEVIFEPWVSSLTIWQGNVWGLLPPESTDCFTDRPFWGGAVFRRTLDPELSVLAYEVRFNGSLVA